MATFDEVLRMLEDGSDATTIMNKCGLSPSKLGRILSSRAMRQHIAVHSALAAAQLRLRLAQRLIGLPQRLVELTQSPDSEVSRRACMNLLKEIETLGAISSGDKPGRRSPRTAEKR